MRQPNSTKVCSYVDLVTEVMVDGISAMINVDDSLEAVLLNHDVTEDEGRVDATLESGLGAKGEQDVSFGVLYKQTMNDAQVNYTVTEKELLAMEKFRPYLMGAKVIVHTDHTTLCYLMTKKDSKARLMR
uniref:Uncharacterized protein LOC104220843 n=1 Tax=Nicotiana sylvestris TaxID=4096 RepID=A0A1U7VQB9_NICSY|nr:PREDICTED: uncharacterized protein LOC104220843 [Nicotiana sylvestris]